PAPPGRPGPDGHRVRPRPHPGGAREARLPRGEGVPGPRREVGLRAPRRRSREVPRRRRRAPTRACSRSRADAGPARCAEAPARHMMIRSICDFAPNRVRATAALACLVEGDLGGAKEMGGENNPAIPARFWKWGADAARLLDPDTGKKENDARYVYYFAVLNQ